MKKSFIFLCSLSVLFFFGFKNNNRASNAILMIMADKNFFKPEFTLPKMTQEKFCYNIKAANILKFPQKSGQ